MASASFPLMMNNGKRMENTQPLKKTVKNYLIRVISGPNIMVKASLNKGFHSQSGLKIVRIVSLYTQIICMSIYELGS